MIEQLLHAAIDEVKRHRSHAAAALLLGSGLVTPAAGQVSVDPSSVSAYTLTPERMAASFAALMALCGAVIGAVALARSRRRIGSTGRRGAIVALVLAPIGLIVGGLVVATADGGLGTGNGLGGGVAAMTAGLIGVTLGGMALARSRRGA